MEKLSTHKILAVLGAVPDTLTKLAEERDSWKDRAEALQQEINTYQLNERVEKVAQEVHEKGIEQGRTIDETREFLLQKAASGELDAVEQAINWTAASTPLGHVGEKPTGGSDLDEFVLS